MSETPESWRLLQALFALAESAPEQQRAALLEQACDDPVLRRRVLNMVASLSAPVAAPDVNIDATLRRVGPYTLLKHLGAGGVGTVYLAERIFGGAPQRVALKMLAPHAVGVSFIERFHREQHILASLDHPNITRMLDAGVADGQPYLVMEYVEGTHLDEYCDANRLTLRARIELFVQVCAATAYAHRNLIVHLDLKPSNVLVTEHGVVKLLDFGTSKLIQPDHLATTTLLATPAYASPEQLRHEPVTTACDVYSLGAILFYLLAGRRVGTNASVALAIEHAMNAAEPEPLANAATEPAAQMRGLTTAQLRHALGGDLGTITGKCLRPYPVDRYPSVDALIADLERFLDGRPVLARPQTMLYLTGKFLRRHRWSAALAGMLVALLMATGSYAAWRQHEALVEGRRAETMQTFMYRLFKLANSHYTGKPAATVSDFLKLGVRLVPDYVKDPADLRQAQLGLAESMFDNGALDSAEVVFKEVVASAKQARDVGTEAEAEAFAGNIAYMKGDMQGGASLTAHALELSRQRGVPPTVRVWSDIYYAWNRDDNGFRSDENVRLLKRAVAEAQENHLPERETADALYNLAEDLELRGRMSEATPAFRQALAIYDKDPAALCEQSDIYGDLAWITQMAGNIAASLPLYEKAYDGLKRCSGPDSRGALTEQGFMAGVLVELGRGPEALSMMEAAMPTWRALEGTSPDLAEPLNFLTLAELATHHYAQAESHAREMVDIQTGKVDANDRRFGVSHMLWARALVGQNRPSEALGHARIADALLARNALSAGAKAAGAEAHQLLLSLQAP
jgi:tetratricopeptide (TPR) repeat protein